jgi:photosystem II stability/assembly factor-like uncharacterized protein
MAKKVFTAQDGVIWVQTGGPNSAPGILGCAEIGDIAEPAGDITQIYAPHPYRRGEWQVVGRSKGAPGAKTFQITLRTPKQASFLEEQRCPINVYVLQSECADKRLFAGGYERLKALYEAELTDRSESNLAALEGDEPSTQSYSYSFAESATIYPLRLARQLIAATQAATDVAFLNITQCRGACGPAIAPGQYGWVALAAGTSAQKPYYTEDGGATWTAASTAPFAAEHSIAAVEMVLAPSGARRAIVADGTAGTGAAVVAFTENLGATWRAASVGSGTGTYVAHSGALFALDYFNVWCGLSDGTLHFSGNGGANWELNAALSGGAITAIHFLDENTGLVGTENNALFYTSDKGANWESVRMPAAKTGVDIYGVVCLDGYNWWVAYKDGDLYYTIDAGEHWNRRVLTVPGYTVAAINAVAFLDSKPYIGFVAGRCTAGTNVYGFAARSFDGGYTWEAAVTPALDSGAPGLVAIVPLEPNLAMTAGGTITTATVYAFCD